MSSSISSEHRQFIIEITQFRLYLVNPNGREPCLPPTRVVPSSWLGRIRDLVMELLEGDKEAWRVFLARIEEDEWGKFFLHRFALLAPEM